MLLPKVLQSIVNSLYTRNRVLADGDDEQRRQLCKMIAEQAAFALPGQNYGWKSAGPGRPGSKDVIAKNEPSGLIGWDLFDGATRQPAWWRNGRDEGGELDSIMLPGQMFIPVVPVNHLNLAEPKEPPNEPPNEPPGGDDDDDITHALDKLIAVAEQIVEADALLTQAVIGLNTRIDSLRADPPKVKFTI